MGASSSRKESKNKVALVCDWLTTPGGAEKVLLELHHMYPDAPIYTSQYSKKGISWFDDAIVKTGWLQIFPKSLRKFLGPLRQIYFSHLDLSSYDLIISVTGAEAKSIRTQPKGLRKKTKNNSSSETALFDDESNWSLTVGELSPRKCPKHLCYCHVPTQYYWQMYDKYVENPGFGFLNPLVRACLKLLVKPLRRADYHAAQHPDQFVTISSYAQDQIKQYYNRESVIISPNVDVAKFRPASFQNLDFHQNSTTFPQKTSPKSTASPQGQARLSTKTTKFSTSYPPSGVEKSTETPDFSTTDLFRPGNYYIISCRQVTWKRVDLAISACRQLELPLLVVGDGSEHQALVKFAAGSPYIKFLPWATPDQLASYLQNAKVYLFPSLEPFGIAAVEALAAGCPVIAYAEGGSRDIVIPGENGLLFDEQTPESLIKAIQQFRSLQFDRKKVSLSADRFSTKCFRQGIKSLVAKALSDYPEQHVSPHRDRSSSSRAHDIRQKETQ